MRDESKPTAARVSAATALLDRGYGKAPQAVTLSGNDTPPIDLIRLVVVHPCDVMRSVGDQYPIAGKLVDANIVG
jgi:hypothetical protein